MSFMFFGTVKISAKSIPGEQITITGERQTYDSEVIVRGTKS